MKKIKRGQKSEIFGRLLKLNQTRGQIKLSFSMIVSVILIIIFIVFAFYAIQKFLKIQDAVKARQFVENLQSDIDNAWKGSQRSQEVEYILPEKIKHVCFIDTGSEESGLNGNLYDELKSFCYYNENMVFEPVGSAQGIESKEIKHINITKITETENPFCFENIKGKVKMTIQKSFGDALVTITD